jgi:hypothetical protein
VCERERERERENYCEFEWSKLKTFQLEELNSFNVKELPSICPFFGATTFNKPKFSIATLSLKEKMSRAIL